jgi:predicted molibdopterin-dependent oxidoreductase YjgC
MEYRWMNRGDRIEAPLVAEGRELVAVSWDHALARAAEALRGASGKAVALASPRASTEALFLVKKLLSRFQLTSAFRVERVAGEFPLPGVANLALRGERAPNVAGATLLGYLERQNPGEIFAGAAVGLVLDDALEGISPEQLRGAAQLIYLGPSLPEAARGARVVLPVANVAEEDGTFVNRDRRVQRYFQAKAAPGMARPAWWVLGELLAQLQLGGPFDAADEAFAWLAAEEGQFGGLSYGVLGTQGVILPAQRPAKVGA